MNKYFWFLAVMFLIVDGRGQTLKENQVQFLKHNAVVICNEPQAKPNWDRLTKQLSDKKLILLGELNHGSKEIFELRNSLIQHLHRQLGIKTILFESGIGELITVDLDKSVMTPREMTNGLFGGWRTREFEELMEYIKTNNVSIAGFDVQRTGGSFNFILKKIAVKKGVDSLLYYNLETRYGLLARELAHKNAIYDSLKTKTQKLISDYEILQPMLSGKPEDASRDVLFTLMSINNRIRLLTYLLTFVKDKNWNKRWAARDSAMADNIIWLLDNIYKNEPIIVIAHNFHTSRYNEKEVTMGELLKPRYGNKMYSLGVFAEAGAYRDNFGKVIQMLPADSAALDIKHVIDRLSGTVNFIHIPQKRTTGDTWLYEKLIINDTFIDLSNSNTMTIFGAFDGLLLLDRISPSVNEY